MILLTMITDILNGSVFPDLKSSEVFKVKPLWQLQNANKACVWAFLM